MKSRRGPCARALAGGLGSPRSQGKACSARPLRLPLFPLRSWGLGVRPHFPVSAPPSGKCVLGLAAAPPSVVLGRSSKSTDAHHHELRECPARSSLLSPVPCFLFPVSCIWPRSGPPLRLSASAGDPYFFVPWCLGGSPPLSIADFGLKSRRARRSRPTGRESRAGCPWHTVLRAEQALPPNAGGLGSPRSQGKACSARPLRLPLFPLRSWGLGVRPHFPVSAPPSGKCVLGLAAAPPSVVLGRSSKSTDAHHHELRECPARSSLLSPVPCFLFPVSCIWPRSGPPLRLSASAGVLFAFPPPLPGVCPARKLSACLRPPAPARIDQDPKKGWPTGRMRG